MTTTRAKGSLGVKPPGVSFTEPRGHTEPPFEKGQGILLWHKGGTKPSNSVSTSVLLLLDKALVV